MLFTQFEFILLFLPAVVFAHEILRSPAQRVRLLVLASVVFYAAWDVRFLPLILASLFGNFALGRLLHRKRTRGVLVAGIVFNLLPLAWCKYGIFLLENAGVVVRGTAAEPFFPAAIPLGISFYTFQQLAYLVDVYQHGLVEKRIAKYSFFTLFFPQLIAGPIVHHQEIIPQVGRKVERAALFFSGIVYFLIGYTKKFFIADGLAAFVDPLYAPGAELAFQGSLVATLGYTFQLYFDFSGYSDMAIGLGMLFGFRLPINFISPYKARSISDFWRRWHITLSRFLRDYLYIPLGGNRRGELVRYRNLAVTMLLGGLWHGAGWTFVLWGGAHGVLLALEQLFKRHFPRLRLGWLGYPLTFAAVALLWVPFRAENLKTTFAVYRGFFDFRGLTFDESMLWVAFAGVLVLGPSSHGITGWLQRVPEGLRRYPYTLRRRAFAYVTICHLLVASTVYAFYATDLDRRVYRALPIQTTAVGIDNREGDFRTNLYRQEVLHGDERKVVFVGSSFTQELGVYRFEKDGVPYKSGTLGIGGNTLINGLRSATAVMDRDDVDTIVMGVSPLNMGHVVGDHAFPGEGMAPLRELGIDVAASPLSEVDAVAPTPAELVTFITDSDHPRFRQFHGFLHNLGSVFHRHEIEVRPAELGGLEEFLDRIEAEAAVPVPDGDNGNDRTFRWNERGIFASLEEGGEVRVALDALKKTLDARSVRLVLYDTPTPTHAQAPEIYPAGFLERYRREMRAMTAELGIEYHDLTDLLPWSGAFMNDFIHPTVEARQRLHLVLLQRMYGAS